MRSSALAAALAAAALFMGLGCARSPAPAPAATPAKAAPAVPRYEGLLAQLDAELAQAQAEARLYPQSWAMRERIAGLYLRRARFSGQYEDYDHAREQLDQARGQAGHDGAVCLTQARLEFALHRLAATAAALEACRRRVGFSGEQQQELAGLAADLALYQGRYAEALALMRADLAAGETIGGLARLSRYHASTGQRVEALALLDRADASYHGDSAELRAWLRLQRAVIELDSGLWENALAWLLAAEREVQGWWLVDEHIAEVRALLGQTEIARGLYRDIVRRSDLPEYRSAWAAVEAAAGDPAQARQLDQQATAAFRERLARWPEAAAGHALDHFLRQPDAAEALALAQANRRNRPYGDAELQLARAYLQAGRPREARALLTAVLRTPWDTAELHWLAAQTYAATGQAELAAAQRQRALEINRRAEQQYGLVAVAAPMVVGARRNGPP